MLTMLPQFTIGAVDAMAIFLLLSALGMLIVILAGSVYVVSVNTAGTSMTLDAGLAVSGFIVGKLWMASMLPMVALYNAIGGGAAGAFAAVELLGNGVAGTTRLVVTLSGALLGAVSLSGSVTAWTRLSAVFDRPLRARGRQAITLAFMAVTLAVSGYIVYTTQSGAEQTAAPGLIYLLLGCALLFGALLTLPLGRARMPMAISVYNGCTGLAVGLEGFVLGSPALLLAGLALGTARMLLTLQMARR